MVKRRLAVLVLAFLLVLVPAGRARAQEVSAVGRRVKLVGQIGGAVNAVAAQGPYAFYGVGQSLIVLDTLDAAQPQLLGRLLLPDTILGIYPADTRLYVAARGAGLWTVDIGDPTQPFAIGEPFYGLANDVLVAGQYAYVASGSIGLRILDISGPGRPALVAYCDTPGDAQEVALAEGPGGRLYAYVADAGSLQILDVTEPARPAVAGSYAAPVASVALAGSYAFLARQYTNSWEGGVEVLDVSDPAHPRSVSSRTFGRDTVVRCIRIAGRYAYLACTKVGLKVLDIGDPSQLTVAGSNDALLDTQGFWVAGDRLYVAGGLDGPRIVDISAPGRPQTLGTWPVPGEVMAVRISGARAYLLSAPGTLSVIDVSQPGAPLLLGSYTPPAPTDGSDPHVTCLAVAGSYAYLAGPGRFLVLDVSDPAHIAQVGMLAGSRDLVWALQARDSYIYLRQGNTVLLVVDVSDPANPTPAGQIYVPGGSEAMAIAGGYLYTGKPSGRTEPAGLCVVDIEDPQHPQIVTVWRHAGDVYAVAAVADHVYLGTWGNIEVVRVSNPAAPYLVSRTRGAFDKVESLALADDLAAHPYAYVAAGKFGLRVFDLSDPAHPVEVGSYDTSGGHSDVTYGIYDGAKDVAVANGLAYVADRTGGLEILRFSPLWVTAVITPAGGSLSSPEDRTAYTFPAGAFGSTVTVTHRIDLQPPSPPAGLKGTGHSFVLSAVDASTGLPAGLAAGQSVSVTVQYTAAESAGMVEGTLGLYTWDGAAWSKETSSTLDMEHRILTAQPDHLGAWAVLGEARQLYLPISIRCR